MKIHGSNQANFNPYQKQIQKQAEHKKEINQKDHLEISSQAKQLQESGKPDATRAAYVQEIKNAVESGEYQVNHGITAKKMIDFWSR